MRQNIGTHTIEVVDDLVLVVSQGAWSLAQTDEMIAIWNEILARTGRLFYIGDFSQGIDLDADCRRRLISWAKTHKFNALALIVTSLPVRALATLVVRGAQLMNPSSPSPTFCSSMAEAKAVIERARRS